MSKEEHNTKLPMTTCANCGKTVLKESTFGNDFCSQDCQLEATGEVNCSNCNRLCNKDELAYKIEDAFYCSDKCAGITSCKVCKRRYFKEHSNYDSICSKNCYEVHEEFLKKQNHRAKREKIVHFPSPISYDETTSKSNIIEKKEDDTLPNEFSRKKTFKEYKQKTISKPANGCSCKNCGSAKKPNQLNTKGLCNECVIKMRKKSNNSLSTLDLMKRKLHVVFEGDDHSTKIVKRIHQVDRRLLKAAKFLEIETDVFFVRRLNDKVTQFIGPTYCYLELKVDKSKRKTVKVYDLLEGDTVEYAIENVNKMKIPHMEIFLTALDLRRSMSKYMQR